MSKQILIYQSQTDGVDTLIKDPDIECVIEQGKPGAPAAYWVPVEECLRWVDNPRDNEDAVDDVVRGIERFGFGAPLVRRKANGEIIAGDTRIQAAMRLGMTTVPVRDMDLSEEDAHMLARADNKLGELARWDSDLLLKQLLFDVERDGVEAVTLQGWSEEDFTELMKDLDDVPILDDVFPPEPSVPDPIEPDPIEPPKDPVTKRGDIEVKHGDCRAIMADMSEGSVDAVVTDPPYNLGFMGKAWDSSGIAFDVGMWREVLRVLKPGGHLLAFGGTRTSHRMVCAIEDAGFEVRDTLVWMHGQGFPKSRDVSKAIDAEAGAERDQVRRSVSRRDIGGSLVGLSDSDRPWLQAAARAGFHDHDGPDPVSEAAKQWDGWGSALKPAHEAICVARKPFEGTIAANVQEHGTGALNVDGCRVGTSKRVPGSGRQATDRIFGTYGAQDGSESGHDPNIGRWPPNVLLDDEAAAMLDEQSGNRPGGAFPKRTGPRSMFGLEDHDNKYHGPMGDSGGASRFFPRFKYTPKASAGEREAGADFEHGGVGALRDGGVGALRDGGRENTEPRANTHNTVKPVSLMRWLVRLVTPPGGTVLDPFAGSGTTGIACIAESFNFIGCELEEEYVKIARRRLDYAAIALAFKEAKT